MFRERQDKVEATVTGLRKNTCIGTCIGTMGLEVLCDCKLKGPTHAMDRATLVLKDIVKRNQKHKCICILIFVFVFLNKKFWLKRNPHLFSRGVKCSFGYKAMVLLSGYKVMAL